MEPDPDNSGIRESLSDNHNLDVATNVRDYIIMWRGQTHAYYLTEYSLIEASFRSGLSEFGFAQIPVFGRTINRKLSKKAAEENLTLATIGSLRKNDKIIKEIRWDNVEKASIIGNKLRVTSKTGIIKLTFLKKWENTSWGKSILCIFATYINEKFTTDHYVPANAKEIVQASLNKSLRDRTYRIPVEMMTPEGNKQKNRASETPFPVKEMSGHLNATSKEEPTSKVSEPKDSKDAYLGKTSHGGWHSENNGKIISRTEKTDGSKFGKFKLQIAVLLIVVIVVSSVLMIYYNSSSKSSAGEPYVTYGNHVYSSDTNLTANVFAGNITIDVGVTVFTNGFNFFLSGKFVNNGNLITGSKYLSQNLLDSYGGSGGGGGYSYTTNDIGKGGYSTMYHGGSGGNIGGNGLSANSFDFNSSDLYLWYNSSASSSFPDQLSQYLMGAAGGVSGNVNNTGASIPGMGAYGIVIIADTIDAGTIHASGTSSTGGGAGSGGGGGGVILLLYGKGGIVNGTYYVSGGSGLSPGISYADNYGGNGGNGVVIEI